MAALTAANLIRYKANPPKFSYKVTTAGTYYAGGLMFGLAAGQATKVPAASLPFRGITAATTVAAANTEVECFVGPMLIKIPSIAAIAAADEDSFLGVDVSAGTFTDDTADLISLKYAASGPDGDQDIDDTDILIGRIIRVDTDGIWLAIPDLGQLGVASVQAATVATFR